jgi:DMSO/TMAO reductase YedYZ heme-binding membrane subunit
MKSPAFAKSLVFINALVPLGMLCWDGLRGQLGANPTEAIIHTTGVLAILFLMLSLSVTPVRKVTGWNFLSHFRRMLGLFAFFYAALHLMAYFKFDRQLNLAGVLEDVGKRWFILLGMAALVLMAPLAATSTNGMVKRLGAAKWKALHRLAYVSAVLGVIHFYMSKKADKNQPLAFAIVLAVLLGYRMVAPVLAKLKKSLAKPQAVGG